MKTEKRIIEGVDITVAQFPALRGLRLMTRLGALLSPVLAALDGAESISLKSDVSVLAPLFSRLFCELTPDAAVSLAGELLANSYAVVDEKKVELSDASRIDIVFDGNLAGLLKACAFSLEVNFMDFIGDLKGGDM